MNNSATIEKHSTPYVIDKFALHCKHVILGQCCVASAERTGFVVCGLNLNVQPLSLMNPYNVYTAIYEKLIVLQSYL